MSLPQERVAAAIATATLYRDGVAATERAACAPSLAGFCPGGSVPCLPAPHPEEDHAAGQQYERAECGNRVLEAGVGQAVHHGNGPHGPAR